MFNWIKKLVGTGVPLIKKLSEKETKTAAGEPYVHILGITIDPDTPRLGDIELDWNSHFITFLKKNGYAGQSDEQVVDQWFQDVCRHVVLETYEQDEASSKHFVTKRKIDDSRTEIG